MSEQKTVRARDIMNDRYVEIDGLTTVKEAIQALVAADASVLIVHKRDQNDEFGIVQLSDIAKKVLAKAGMTTDDIDLYEINEAFAVVAAKFVRDLDLDWDKVNVNGGSIALGHPIGATGSILIGTIVDELERQGKQYGLVTMCAAGGMAPAIIVERVEDFVD